MPKKIPVATLDPQCVWQPDKDVAALTALERAPYGRKESAGVLYRNANGEYCYSLPVAGSDDRFELKVDASGGLTFDSIYHTHGGGGKDDHRFSDNDVRTADTLKRESYIRDDATREVRKYTPDESPVDSSPRPGAPSQRIRTSPGKVVGTLPEKTRREQLADAYDLHNPPATP